MQSQKRIDKYHFSLKRLLGQGSYASVYRGKVTQTSEPVAVKVIDKRIFTNSFNLKNLHCEIQIMKKVNHPNIVHLHDVLQTSNNMYIITELCDCDLQNLLKERRRLPEQEAIILLKQIMAGVKYLNSQNIIHRDLKPANILLREGQCKISDFGFAKNLQADEALLKSIVGTPLYMSPQLLQKQKYTNKSDLWSIGLIFYELLHGRTPWMAQNQLQLINAIYSQKIQFSKLISQLSRDFISKCLCIDQTKRISWEEAFDHPLITGIKANNFSISIRKQSSCKVMESKSAILSKDFQKGNHQDTENNSMIINFNNTQTKQIDKKRDGLCLTPKIHKNVSQIRLKKVQALTPKASFTNINNKLKQVCALSSQMFIKKQTQSIEPIDRRRRNLTVHFQAKQLLK